MESLASENWAHTCSVIAAHVCTLIAIHNATLTLSTEYKRGAHTHQQMQNYPSQHLSFSLKALFYPLVFRVKKATCFHNYVTDDKKDATDTAEGGIYCAYTKQSSQPRYSIFLFLIGWGSSTFCTNAECERQISVGMAKTTEDWGNRTSVVFLFRSGALSDNDGLKTVI